MCIQLQHLATMPDPAQFVTVSQPPQRGAIKKPTHQDPNANTDLFSRLFSEEGTLHFSLQLFDSVEQLVTDQLRTNIKMSISSILMKGVLT